MGRPVAPVVGSNRIAVVFMDGNKSAKPQTPRQLLERMMEAEARVGGVQGMRVSGSPHRRVHRDKRRFVGSYDKSQLTRTGNAHVHHRQTTSSTTAANDATSTASAAGAAGSTHSTGAASGPGGPSPQAAAQPPVNFRQPPIWPPRNPGA